MLKHENIYANIDVFIPLSELSVETLTHFRKKVNILLSFSFHSYCYFTYSCLSVSLVCLSIVPDLLSQVC